MESGPIANPPERSKAMRLRIGMSLTNPLQLSWFSVVPIFAVVGLAISLCAIGAATRPETKMGLYTVPPVRAWTMEIHQGDPFSSVKQVTRINGAAISIKFAFARTPAGVKRPSTIRDLDRIATEADIRAAAVRRKFGLAAKILVSKTTRFKGMPALYREVRENERPDIAYSYMLQFVDGGDYYFVQMVIRGHNPTPPIRQQAVRHWDRFLRDLRRAAS